jgi:hypothetical protein
LSSLLTPPLLLGWDERVSAGALYQPNISLKLAEDKFLAAAASLLPALLITEDAVDVSLGSPIALLLEVNTGAMGEPTTGTHSSATVQILTLSPSPTANCRRLRY